MRYIIYMLLYNESQEKNWVEGNKVQWDDKWKNIHWHNIMHAAPANESVQFVPFLKIIFMYFLSFLSLFYHSRRLNDIIPNSHVESIW